MNYNEFAESIKAKYPEYKDKDNLTLSKAMVEKYPEYADRVTFEEPIKKEFVGELSPEEQLAADRAKLLDPLKSGLAGLPFSPYKHEPTTLMGGVSKTVSNLAPLLALPAEKLAASAGTGALTGAEQAYKEGKSLPSIAQSALYGGTAGAALHGAGKGYEKFAEPTIDKALLFLSGIRKPVAEAATESGSKVLDFVKQIEEGHPEEEVRKISGEIRKPLNEQLLKTTKELGQNVGKAKENLFQNVKEKIPFQFNELKNKINKMKSDRHYKQNDLVDTLTNYLDELEEGVTPERAFELREFLKPIIKWNPTDRPIHPFEKITQDIAQGLRSEIKEKLANLSPELKEANKQFSEFKQLKETLPKSFEGFSENKYNAAAKAAQQTNALKAATQNSSYELMNKLINKLPGGKQALKGAKELGLAKQLANLDISGKRIPLSKWSAALGALTAAPREIAIQKVLPKMLAKSEGRILPPDQIQQSLQRLSKLSVSKGLSYITPDGTIPAQNVRAERQK